MALWTSGENVSFRIGVTLDIQFLLQSKVQKFLWGRGGEFQILGKTSIQFSNFFGGLLNQKYKSTTVNKVVEEISVKKRIGLIRV